MNEKKIEKMAAVLKVLGHPDRLRILSCLIEEGCYVKEISEKLDLHQSTVSQHLRVMSDKGILMAHREGVKVCYEPTDCLARKIAEIVLEACED